MKISATKELMKGEYFIFPITSDLFDFYYIVRDQRRFFVPLHFWNKCTFVFVVYARILERINSDERVPGIFVWRTGFAIEPLAVTESSKWPAFAVFHDHVLLLPHWTFPFLRVTIFENLEADYFLMLVNVIMPNYIQVYQIYFHADYLACNFLCASIMLTNGNIYLFIFFLIKLSIQ